MAAMTLFNFILRCPFLCKVHHLNLILYFFRSIYRTGWPRNTKIDVEIAPTRWPAVHRSTWLVLEVQSQLVYYNRN